MIELTQEQRDAIKADSENGFGANVGDTQRLLDDYASLEQECERLRVALNFACKSLAQVTSSDGSGHADIAFTVMRMAGIEEGEKLVGEWKARSQWRIDAALSAKP